MHISLISSELSRYQITIAKASTSLLAFKVMVWAVSLFTAKYLVELITTGKWDDGLSDSFKIPQERLERGKAAPPYIAGIEKIGGVTSKS
ncbi:hypothetical protein L204_100653 [Cryptococcus depauperatus]